MWITRQDRPRRDTPPTEVIGSRSPVADDVDRGVSAILTANAQIMCIHGGQVMLTPSQMSVLVAGGPVCAFPIC